MRTEREKRIRLALGVALGVIVFFVTRPRVGPAHIMTARTAAMELRRAAETWRWDHADGGCPTSAQLVADHRLDPQSKPTDPWGTPFAIECDADETVVTSAGKDKMFGTSDDTRVPVAAARDGG